MHLLLMYIRNVYNTSMFEWDEGKRALNLEKHALDFQDAWRLFDGTPRNQHSRKDRNGNAVPYGR